jgi:hypothetical protein
VSLGVHELVYRDLRTADEVVDEDLEEEDEDSAIEEQESA